MTGERRFTRIPPESTGDRIYQVHTAEIGFSAGGANIGHTWQIGEQYSIQDFGGTGKVHVHGAFDANDGTGILAVHYNKTAKFKNEVPAVGKNIYYPAGTTNVVGVVTEAYDVYIPTTNIMGFDNPEFGLDITNNGSARVGFVEGEPQLDAWGKLRTNGATQLGKYVFSNASEFVNNYSAVATRAGAGVVPSDTTAVSAYDDTGKYIQVEVNNEGDLATATSKTYHHYIAGSSHLFMGTCLFSGASTLDSPVATGVSRRFGLFDADNGFMFHVGPDGNLYLERRSKISGTKVDTLLACSDATTAETLGIDTFNGDILNGSRSLTNRSGMKLDLGKDNLYWIDIQWHGAGRVRFGTFFEGQRVVIHSYYHGNSYTEPMSATASLPQCQAIRAYTDAEIDAGPWATVLTGGNAGATAATEVYIRVWSAAVWTETDIDLQTLGSPRVFASPHVDIPSATFKHLFSVRPQPVKPSGKTNHDLFVPTLFSVSAFDANIDQTMKQLGASRDALIHWKVQRQTVHSGHEWTNVLGTEIQLSTAGVNYEELTSNKRAFEDMYNGYGAKNLTETYVDIQNGAFKNASDDGGTKFEAISAVTNSSSGSDTIDGATASSGRVITLNAVTLSVGASVSGTNVPAGAVVMSIDGNDVSINKDITAQPSGALTYTNPTSVTTSASEWTLGEPYTKTFGPNPGGGLYDTKNFAAGGITLSTTDVYLKYTGLNTAVLYADADWTTPVTSTGSYTGGAELYGFIGSDFVWNIYGKQMVDGVEDVRALFTVEFKEIAQ